MLETLSACGRRSVIESVNGMQLAIPLVTVGTFSRMRDSVRISLGFLVTYSMSRMCWPTVIRVSLSSSPWNRYTDIDRPAGLLIVPDHVYLPNLSQKLDLE